jgi:hypothetical protein
VLKATPDDVEAGVQVGDTRYRFYPGSAVGLADSAFRVGFFALRHDQDVNARIAAYARDAAGNEVTTPLEHQPFVKKFVQSKIPIDQKFLDRVVPAIASNTPELKIDTGSPEGLLKGFLEINGNLRKKNGDFIASLAEKSEPRMLWTEAFAQMVNSQVSRASRIAAPIISATVRSTSRCTSASTWRRCSRRRCTPRTPAKLSSPTSSAFTATA